MALQRGKKVGGDFLDFKELFRDNDEKAFLIVARLRSFEEPEPGDFGAYKVPVNADILICSGPSVGAVHLNERIIGAPTGPLRGVVNPKKDERPPFPTPVYPIGQELVFRVSVTHPKGSNAFVAFDEPSDPEYAAVEAVYAGGKGWDGPALAATGTDGVPVSTAKTSPAAAVADEPSPWR